MDIPKLANRGGESEEGGESLNINWKCKMNRMHGEGMVNHPMCAENPA
eukprot:CAMPEP_0114283898 /NCGR_PEP_ID=MMETSP0059-20121206/4356_1 /TAXON_ID=36894 /ORGANISM="Pyramimonas parkeae, Strain CCMP726" /LENGTH=47 /DNA_ID= /DNA_START= /DNA_END= /DNA_ORIENTATION=